MPHVLLQIVVVPIIASFLILFSRPIVGWKAGWIAVASLVYTSVLLCLTGLNIYQGIPVYEGYPLIGNYMKFDLMADGLSLPIALIINLICVVLALYSMHYVEHRVDILYGTADDNTKLKIDGVFISIGEIPQNQLAKKLGVKLDDNGYIITDKQQRTNVKGVYAAGDITGGLRQIITACAEGAIAALSSTEVLGKLYPY